MRKIMFLLVIMAFGFYSALSAETLEYTFTFHKDDFQICEIETTEPLTGNAKLVSYFPLNKSQFFLPNEYCELIKSYLETSSYVNKYPNYCSMHYFYLLPYGKAFKSASVKINSEELLYDNAYIYWYCHDELAKYKSTCNETSSLRFSSGTESSIESFISRYSQEIFPEYYGRCSHNYASDYVTVEVFPIHTVGNIVYLTTSLTISIEVDDYSGSNALGTYNSWKNRTEWLLNPEALATYKDQTALEEVPAEELLNISSNVLTLKDTDVNAVSAIFSADGRQVMSFTGGTADISTLPQGLYVIRTTAANGKNLTAKFVK